MAFCRSALGSLAPLLPCCLAPISSRYVATSGALLTAVIRAALGRVPSASLRVNGLRNRRWWLAASSSAAPAYVAVYADRAVRAHLAGLDRIFALRRRPQSLALNENPPAASRVARV